MAGFLNGEPLGDMDWRKLAALPRDCDRGPTQLLGQLARACTAALGAPLVICVDQIEASDITGKNHDPFLRATGTACELIENVPGLMVLLSCLDSAYDDHAPHLRTSFRHRIENDPRAVALLAGRDANEIRQIVSRRLKWLYESEGLEHVPPDSVFPMPEDVPERLARGGRVHLRDALLQVRSYWEACKKAGDTVDWTDTAVSTDGKLPSPEVDRLRLAWNEFRTAGDHAVADDEETRLDLLAWALGQVPLESAEPMTVRVDRPAAAASKAVPRLALAVERPRAEILRRVVGLCEKDSRGGGLSRQLAAFRESAAGGAGTVAVVRSSRFGKGERVIEQMAGIESAGGVCLVIEENVLADDPGATVVPRFAGGAVLPRGGRRVA